MSRRRRKGHGGGGGHGSGADRWLVSYADFITLLFAFFVVLYAISKVDAEKMENVMTGIRTAMDFEGQGGGDKPPMFDGSAGKQLLGQPTPGNPGREGAITVMDKKLLELKEQMEKDLLASVGRESQNDAVEFDITEKGIRIRLTGGYFFDAGSSVLRPEAIPIVDGIIRVLGNRKEQIRVEGHTDDQKGVDKLFNWKLSSDRALALMGYMIKGAKMDPRRLQMSSFAQYRPVTTNATPEGRALNRRLDIFLLNPRVGVAEATDAEAREAKP